MTGCEADKVRNHSEANFILLTLFMVLTSSQMCRQLVFNLSSFSPSALPLIHLNKEFNMSKELYGSVFALLFSVSFALTSTFSGCVAESFNRKLIVVASCFAWSMFTGLHFCATSVNQLGILRFGIAASQALFTPAAFMLLSDSFPKEMFGVVTGMFTSAIYVGGALASLSIQTSYSIGWRKTMFWFGILGLIPCVLSAIAIEEKRKQTDKTVPKAVPQESHTSETTNGFPFLFSLASLKDAIKALKGSLLPFIEVTATPYTRYIFAASLIRFFAGFIVLTWKTPYILSAFPDSSTIYSQVNAAVVAGGGITSSVVGGYLSDYLYKRNISRCWIPVGGNVLAAACWAGFMFNSHSLFISLAFLGGVYLFGECWYGPTLSALNTAVPHERRGTTQALFSLMTAFGNVAPVVVGMCVGKTFVGVPLPLQTVLYVGVCSTYLLSAALFSIAAIHEHSRNKSGARDLPKSKLS